jgi:hypothetical protein
MFYDYDVPLVYRQALPANTGETPHIGPEEYARDNDWIPTGHPCSPVVTVTEPRP